MAELLLVTTRWPYGPVTEFLDREILHLARAFDVVRVAPMRPVGTLRSGLPPNLVVDESLAHAISPDIPVVGRKSRQITGARNLFRRRPTKASLPASSTADLYSLSWWREAALNRADATGVYQWAAWRTRPDVAYTFWLSSATLGLRNAWPQVPLVSRAHGGDVYAYAHGWQTIPQQDQQLAATNWVACASQNGRDYLSNRFPHMRDRFSTRYLGVHDLGGLAQPSGGDALRVLSASSIDQNKRVSLIAECLVSMARAGQRIEWTHLGDGPDRDRVSSVLRQGSAGLETTFPGHVELSSVHDQMLNGRYDVFVNLSKSEGLPVTIMEAQCVGLPVVATAVGGTSEVADPRLNELVSPSPTVAEVSNAILRAKARDRADASHRRARWERYFNSEINYENFARELADMIR